MVQLICQAPIHINIKNRFLKSVQGGCLLTLSFQAVPVLLKRDAFYDTLIQAKIYRDEVKFLGFYITEMLLKIERVTLRKVELYF